MSFADFAKDILPWVCSCLTIWMTHLQGRKDPTSWIIGLANQVLWLVFAIGTKTWGLLLLNAFLWYLYTRNYLLWRKDATPVHSNPIHGVEAGLAVHRLLAGSHVCGAHGTSWQRDCNACKQASYAAMIANAPPGVPRDTRGT